MKNLSNDKISIQIADHGAELVSIYANGTGIMPGEFFSHWILIR